MHKHLRPCGLVLLALGLAASTGLGWAQTPAPARSPAPAATSGLAPTHATQLQVPWQATHIVQEGDTLWDLSRLYQGNPILWRDIGDPNGVAVPKRMQPGTVLLLGNGALTNYAARVVALTGDVRISNVRASGTGKVVNDASLRIGMAVPLGAELRTGPESFVTLALTDTTAQAAAMLQRDELMHKGKPVAGTLVTLPSQSHVKLSSIRDAKGRISVVLELYGGQIDSRAQPAPESKASSPSFFEPYSHQIRTRMATVGVRGTYFRVSLPEGSDTMTTSVLEGQVAAQANKPDGSAPQDPSQAVLLGQAQGAVVSSKGAVQSASLLAAPQWLEGASAQNFPEVRLQWQAVPGAQAYRVQLARDANFIDILAQKDVNAAPGANSTALQVALGNLPAGPYHARVSALNANQLEGLYAPTRFHRGSLVLNTQSTLLEAIKSVQFDWSALPSATYTLEVAPQDQTDARVLHAEGLSATAIRVAALPPGRYVWRVRANTQDKGQSLTLGSDWQPLLVPGAR